MIVKLVIHKDLDALSIWNKEGDRLFYSDKADDLQTAKNLLTIQKKKTDAQVAQEVMTGKPVAPVFELAMHGYFNACWRNKIVQLMKRATGYNW